MKVLVVDDELLVRWFFQRSLGKWGHAVFTAENIHEAKSILSSKRFDLVIIDLQIPDRNGIHLVRRLLSEHYLPEQLVVCSAYVSDAVQSELTLKKIRILHKPFTMNELRQVINQIATGVKEGSKAGDPFQCWRNIAFS